jgi:hypothetical protein
LVSEGGQFPNANHGVDLSLGFLLDIREEDHGQEESVFSRNSRISTTLGMIYVKQSQEGTALTYHRTWKPQSILCL